jgi:alpha-amylase
MRTAMVQAMQFWLTASDVDGFRCDMAMLVPLDFWREARTILDGQKKLFWLAECEESSYHDVFDATYTWRFLHKMESYWKGESGISGLDEVLDYYNNFFPPGALHAFFTSNHDENSHSGTEYDRMGNAAKAFAVLCCTWNGLPLIYSGQELPNLRRLSFFDKDCISWAEPCALHEFYKTLLDLRKRNRALRAADAGVSTVKLQTNAKEKVFSFLRTSSENAVLVLLNLSPADLRVQLDEGTLSGTFKNTFAGSLVNFDQTKSVDLQAWDFLVLEKLST